MILPTPTAQNVTAVRTDISPLHILGARCSGPALPAYGEGEILIAFLKKMTVKFDYHI